MFQSQKNNNQLFLLRIYCLSKKNCQILQTLIKTLLSLQQVSLGDQQQSLLLFLFKEIRNMTVQPNQINEQASIETLSSFLRSSPFNYIGQLSIQQIDVLLYALPSAYMAPVNGNEWPKAAMEQTLNIRRRQLVERNVEETQSADKRKVNFLILLAAYFFALVVISSCFKSTILPIPKDGKVQIKGPQDWELTIGWLGFIIISAIAIFGYWKYIKQIGQKEQMI